MTDLATSSKEVYGSEKCRFASDDDDDEEDD
jgi:hypothetical protein